MIRPFTLICMASAFGAGLYLYQSKHAAQVLDKEIGRTIKQTEQTRERTGMLKAEWALLNEPDRLADLARAHLSLQTLKPTQFAAMGDLAARLPAPVAARPEPLPATPAAEDVPSPTPVAQVPSPAPAVASAAGAGSVPAKAREVASAPEKERDKPKPEPKLADSKPTRPMPERVAPERVAVERVAPDRVARMEAAHEPAAMPVRAREPMPPSASADATAPGTVGAAVLRAMRAQNAGYAPPPPPIRAYAAPAYEPPRAAPAAFAPQAAPAAYAPPPPAPAAYAPQAASMLGGRTALPPPVPFAAR